jgi:hypothetical protein
MTTIAPSSLSRGRLYAVHAEQRVADALLGVALDVLEPFASDYLSADDYNRLCELLQAPVGAASEAALRRSPETLPSSLKPILVSPLDWRERRTAGCDGVPGWGPSAPRDRPRGTSPDEPRR